MPDPERADSTPPGTVRDLCLLFLRLGATAFGGPAAHVALMEDEVVRRRRWLTREAFLDLVGATNLIPGPNSTELAIYIGYQRAGWSGLVVAGVSFIVPAALIVAAIAWGYVRFGTMPQAAAFLYGVKPAVVAVVVQALWRLGPVAARTRTLAALGAAALLLILAGVHELIVIAIVGAAAFVATHPGGPTLGVAAWGILPSTFGAPTAILAPPGAAGGGPGLLPLFLFFCKVGSVLFGSGYVLLAFLRADLVERWHWVTEQQLLDAIAIGQMTPGPVFTTATFIGYLLAGWGGAATATVAIFLPAFVFVAASRPLIARVRASDRLRGLLDGVNVASFALIVHVTWYLGRAAIVDWTSLTLAVASLVCLIRYHVNSSWLVLGGALVGLLTR